MDKCTGHLSRGLLKNTNGNSRTEKYNIQISNSLDRHSNRKDMAESRLINRNYTI